MDRIEFDQAYFIKLGRKGQWEKSSIKESKMRIGWASQSLEDVNGHRWERIRGQLASELSEKGKRKTKGSVTTDLNALRMICESTSKDVWITFFGLKLWWCRIADSEIREDATSKYRPVQGSWSDSDTGQKPLFASRLPGVLTGTQGFRGTVCHVRTPDVLRRVLNDEPSPYCTAVEEARDLLVRKVESAIRHLNPVDCEDFADLLFRQSGWRRLTTVGKRMKFVDMELMDPLTHDRYQVQVKTGATLRDFHDYSSNFANRGYRRLYFVVGNPTANLEHYTSNDCRVELILPKRLAEMAVELGLVDWLMDKVY
ncbi:MAG: hypothetical protein JXA57_14525 [Armatimonadetes bacterium]|nr:hypothetical protein [Armatimonadota bacterium]